MVPAGGGDRRGRAGSVTSAFFTIVLTALYILFMFYLVKPFLRKIGEFYNKQETVSKTLVAFIFLVLIISSYITEILGIHALFGAFLAGVVMPANLSFRRVMTEKIEDVALVLFSASVFRLYGFAYGDRPAEYASPVGNLRAVHRRVDRR